MGGLDYERLVLSAGPLGIMQASVPRLAAARPMWHHAMWPPCPAALLLLAHLLWPALVCRVMHAI